MTESANNPELEAGRKIDPTEVSKDIMHDTLDLQRSPTEDTSKESISRENDDDNSSLSSTSSMSEREGQEENSADFVTDEDELGSDDDDGDLSARQLLQLADRRMSFHSSNDEIKALKEQVKMMEDHLQSMTDQLRLAVESKCALVQTQTEKESKHEQEMFAKDAQIKELKKENQMISEKSAQAIASLAEKMHNKEQEYQTEIRQKDFKIKQLHQQVAKLKLSSSSTHDKKDSNRNLHSRKQDH